MQADNTVPFALPSLGDEEAQAAGRVIRSRWVTQGPEVRAFEKEFAAWVDAKFACAVCSCTTALHLALRAVGVGPSDQVISVSHSFIASANSIRYCQAVPVFVDIDPLTFNMDPSRIEPVITERTKAILCVHQLGMPCDLNAILSIARRHRLPVVEDAACAVGSEILWEEQWQKIGRPHGDVACFSFHPRKVITTGDGGMLTTGNPQYDEQFHRWRQHAMSVPDTVRAKADTVIFEEYPELAYNYRMTDIQAAVGRVQLRRLSQFVQRRRQLAQRYCRLLSGTSIGLPQEPSWARSNWQSFCVRLPDGADQRAVMQQMLDKGVATRRGVMNAHMERAYAENPWSCGQGPGPCGCPPATCRRLVESEKARDRCILLPMFDQMAEQQQDRVVEALLGACGL
jgi:dTDP-4-amino-4,6-dideoxygalactose transaminase